MARRSPNEDRTFSVAFEANMEEIHAAGRQRRKLMHDAWEDIDNGWHTLQQRLVEVGILKSSEEGMLLRWNVGGSHVTVCLSVLREQGLPEPCTLASLFGRVWDKRLLRDADDFIVLDESPTCVKHIMHALLAASGTWPGTAKLALPGDGLPPDEKAYLPYIHCALGLPEFPSSVFQPGEFGRMSAAILGWCPNKPSELELVYRASRDGQNPRAFHASFGEDNASTVTLFRVSNTGPGTGDSVVGGFSSVPWTPENDHGGWRASEDTFVFMLKDGTSCPDSTTSEPVKWDLKQGQSEHAVWCHPIDLPCFGHHDLGMTWRSSFRTLGTGNRVYDIPAGSPFLSLDGQVVTEIEVFRVCFEAATPASELETKSEIKPGLIEIPTIDIATMSAESSREDDIRTFGVSIADSLMEERVALRQAHDDLAEANANAAKSSNALAAVYGPHVAAGEGDTVIELSVRGTRMTTLRSTLQACPDSALAARFDEEKWPATEKDVDERGRRVMDCSPSVFSKVLDVLRMKKRVAWGGGGDERSVKVVVKATDRAAFEEFVGMYFPGCESFIMDSVAGAPLGSTAGS